MNATAVVKNILQSDMDRTEGYQRDIVAEMLEADAEEIDECKLTIRSRIAVNSAILRAYILGQFWSKIV